MSGTDLEIRSYRSVFALERRLYRVDAIRLNPSGIPLRGVAYAACLAALGVMSGSLPLTRWIVEVIPWYLRDLAFPIGLGAALATVKIEGRHFHTSAVAILRRAAGPSSLIMFGKASRWRARYQPASVMFLVDGSEAVPRNMRYAGPGVAVIRYAHDRVVWPPSLVPGIRPRVAIYPLPGAGRRASEAVELARGSILVVSSSQLDPQFRVTA
jgi:hypothetical protein